MFEPLAPDSVTLPIPKPRELYFTKQVNQDTIAELSKNILEINKNDRYLQKIFQFYGIEYKPAPIKLYVDSYGGSVYQCLGLVGIMDESLTPIHTIVSGVAMSAGFIIAIHGHKRLAYKHATLMYHQLSSAAWGKLADMQADVEEATRLQTILEELTLKKTKISHKVLQDNFEKKKDWYMPAAEALKNGCIDEII